jgi:hypothetical protein
MSFKHEHRIREKTFVVIFVFALVAAMLSSVPKVLALGTITSASIWTIETNMDATGTSQFWFSFKSASSGSPSNITITLGGTGAAFAASQTVNTTNCAGASGVFNFLNGGVGATALPGSPTATGSSNVLTIASAGSLTSGTQYCIGFTGSALTNPSAAGIYTVTVADSLDSGSDYYPILASGTNEAITVGASVSQTFTLTLGGTTDTLGTLSTGSVISSSGVNATVSTNAAYGPTLFIYDSQTGLHSTNAAHTIASKLPNNATSTTIVTTTENYIANATYTSNTSGDTMTIAAPFNGTGATGDGLSPYPSELAYATATAAPTNAAIVNIKESATITNITPESSDYSDTVYIVGTGTF